MKNWWITDEDLWRADEAISGSIVPLYTISLNGTTPKAPLAVLNRKFGGWGWIRLHLQSWGNFHTLLLSKPLLINAIAFPNIKDRTHCMHSCLTLRTSYWKLQSQFLQMLQGGQRLFGVFPTWTQRDWPAASISAILQFWLIDTGTSSSAILFPLPTSPK